ncbi:hypothetical protein RFI_19672 [Reticulomyxa filosa]|uniref:Uncharacterized protein n=1 Tax=Reticulomyxa filosa TaxID=46433 RepID=X6MW08_RETFI|nr:hypothetical protein RFI_19672 [Reticulomyxa filosa]|eukprot:ETO17647.1 hypothetical protein RFI_19672 [Reticulomyxa filosa]
MIENVCKFSFVLSFFFETTSNLFIMLSVFNGFHIKSNWDIFPKQPRLTELKFWLFPWWKPMMGIILHEQIVDISWHGMPGVLTQTFNFDLLKQYEYLKKSLQSDIVNTVVLLECSQYTTLLSHRQNSESNCKKTPESVSTDESTSEGEEMCWISEDYETIVSESMDNSEEKMRVDLSILSCCLECFQSKAQGHPNVAIDEFAVFLEYHFHYNTVVAIPALQSVQGDCLLTVEMFATYESLTKGCTYKKKKKKKVSLFRSTFPKKSKDKEKEADSNGNMQITRKADGSIGPEKDLIAREIEELFLSDNEDDLDYNYACDGHNAPPNDTDHNPTFPSKLALSLF